MKEVKDMKILNLIIKQKYFDLIMQGKKVQEFREIRPSTEKKYVEMQWDETDKKFYEIEDENGNSIPIKYDAIRFFVGYNKDRDSALVEVVDAYTEVYVDENGEIIDYEYKGDYYIAQQIVYNLGKILETNIHPKNRV